ncbi:unnamed protein product, partial [Prorocentrum cordatum]
MASPAAAAVGAPAGDASQSGEDEDEDSDTDLAGVERVVLAENDSVVLPDGIELVSAWWRSKGWRFNVSVEHLVQWQLDSGNPSVYAMYELYGGPPMHTAYAKELEIIYRLPVDHAVPTSPRATSPPGVTVLAQIGNLSFWPDLKVCMLSVSRVMKVLDHGFQVFLSFHDEIPEEDTAKVEEIARGVFGSAAVRSIRVENKGADIGPYLRQLQAEAPSWPAALPPPPSARAGVERVVLAENDSVVLPDGIELVSAWWRSKGWRFNVSVEHLVQWQLDSGNPSVYAMYELYGGPPMHTAYAKELEIIYRLPVDHAVPTSPRATSPPGVTVLAQIGNLSFWPDLKVCMLSVSRVMKVLDHGFQVFLSFHDEIPEEDTAKVEEIARGVFGSAAVRSIRVENKGADIGPYLRQLQVLSQEPPDKHYDFFLKIHTKTDTASRRLYLDNLCGKRHTHRVYTSLRQSQAIGMVGCRDARDYFAFGRQVVGINAARVPDRRVVSNAGRSLYVLRSRPISNTDSCDLSALFFVRLHWIVGGLVLASASLYAAAAVVYTEILGYEHQDPGEKTLTSLEYTMAIIRQQLGFLTNSVGRGMFFLFAGMFTFPVLDMLAECSSSVSTLWKLLGYNISIAAMAFGLVAVLVPPAMYLASWFQRGSSAEARRVEPQASGAAQAAGPRAARDSLPVAARLGGAGAALGASAAAAGEPRDADLASAAGMGLMLLALAVVVVTAPYLGQHTDEQLRTNTLTIFSSTSCVFASATCCKGFVGIFTECFDPVEPLLPAALLTVIAYMAILSFVQLQGVTAQGVLRSTMVTATIGRVAVYSAALLWVPVWADVSVWLAEGSLTEHLCWLCFAATLCFLLRSIPAWCCRSSPSEDQERRLEVLRRCERLVRQCEEEAVSLMLSILATQHGRDAITQHISFAAGHASDEAHYSLWQISIAMAAGSLAMAFSTVSLRVCGPTGERSSSASGLASLLQKCFSVVVKTSMYVSAWATLISMEWFLAFYVIQEAMAKAVLYIVVALFCSYFAFGILLATSRLGRELHPTSSEIIETLFKALGVMLGFSWERCASAGRGQLAGVTAAVLFGEGSRGGSDHDAAVGFAMALLLGCVAILGQLRAFPSSVGGKRILQASRAAEPPPAGDPEGAELPLLREATPQDVAAGPPASAAEPGAGAGAGAGARGQR